MNGYVSSNKVLMYSFSSCPFCLNAKKLLDTKGVAYKAVELDKMATGMAIRAELAKATSRTSMPNIFIGGKSVGGCNDGPGIMTLEKEGKLDAMLKEASAPTGAAAKAAPAATPTAPAKASGGNGAVPPHVLEARSWIASWKARSAGGSGAAAAVDIPAARASTGNGEVPAHVKEARDWITKWKNRRS